MITARLYSPEALTPHAKEAVYYGFELIASHVGQIVVLNDHRIKLPTTHYGDVDTSRVGYGNLDPLTELHLIVAPLKQPTYADRRILGLAYLGSGIAFVDPANISTLGGMTTVAHETSHALGFVTKESAQSMRIDPVHCKDASCIMAPTYRPDAFPDFCRPCVNDMDENIDRNVARMGLLRRMQGQVTPLVFDGYQ